MKNFSLALYVGMCLMGTSNLNAGPESSPLQVRGLHLAAPAREGVSLGTRFIRQVLPQEGVNVLVLEINYRYQFRSHPELAEVDALSKEDVKALVAACRETNVQLIPQLNCLGHQSWKDKTFSLLATYPDFDETPEKYPNNEEIYCRSYCPRHPKVHQVIFALIDELAEVFEAKAFHVGMDEVFLLGEDDCPRCKGMNKAQLFADEVRALHDHLSKRNLAMWMWGDRFIDGEISGIGKLEASINHTYGAVDLVPKDIVICDWHYESAPPTPGYFALKGFSVVTSPWRKTEVALAQLGLINGILKGHNPTLASRILGVLQTTWTDPAAFIRAYYGQDKSGGSGINEVAQESAECFKRLFAALRGQDQAN
ncbi:family 20 glycosylhydrolase [Acidobacteria bacterium AH-259-L09]|nr:family 20 glycosylhydrolase [Acidobacteria bacterium AH-259-L09]